MELSVNMETRGLIRSDQNPNARLSLTPIMLQTKLGPLAEEIFMFKSDQTDTHRHTDAGSTPIL